MTYRSSVAGCTAHAAPRAPGSPRHGQLRVPRRVCKAYDRRQILHDEGGQGRCYFTLKTVLYKNEILFIKYDFKKLVLTFYVFRKYVLEKYTFSLKMIFNKTRSGRN